MENSVISLLRIYNDGSLSDCWELSCRYEKVPGPSVIKVGNECWKPIALLILDFSVKVSCYFSCKSKALGTDNWWLHSYLSQDFTTPWFQIYPVCDTLLGLCTLGNRENKLKRFTQLSEKELGFGGLGWYGLDEKIWLKNVINAWKIWKMGCPKDLPAQQSWLKTGISETAEEGFLELIQKSS